MDNKQQLKDFWNKHAEDIFQYGSLIYLCDKEQVPNPYYDPKRKGSSPTWSQHIEGTDPLSKDGWTVTQVDQGGGEDEGYDYGYVYKCSKDGTDYYIYLDGHYYSYDGSYFDEWRFTEPYEKVVTAWT